MAITAAMSVATAVTNSSSCQKLSRIGQNTTNELYEVRETNNNEFIRHDEEEKGGDDDYINPIKCSAVHTLERDMPDYDYSHLVKELRDKLLNEFQLNEGIYAQKDIDKCKQDDWFISRYLLRQKLDIDLAFDMIKKSMRFNHESLLNSIRQEDFPEEFYRMGGVFGYEPDRKGNKMLYFRIKMHRKVPEVNAVLQAFLLYNIQKLDDEANGKGISIVFDCSGAGLACADMEVLLYIITTLKNYFPKGLSYFLVHQLPWILKPFWYIAKAWIPEEHRQLIKFSNTETIYEYVDRENLPDFMGGTCKRDYRAAPENCTTLAEAVKLWGVERYVIRRLLSRFAEYLPKECLDRAEELLNSEQEDEES